MSRHLEISPYETYRKVTIPPQTAAVWLEKYNKHNRAARLSRVASYAADMTAGKWEFTADPIQFSKTLILLNGQNRLAACVASCVPLVALVVTGLEDDAQYKMDQPFIRTSGQNLSMRGIANGSKAASLAGALLSYEKEGPGKAFNTSGRNRSTRTPIEDRAATDARIAPALAVGFALSDKARLIPATTAAFLYYVFSEQAKEKADAFFAALGSGAGLAAQSPVHLFREALVKNATRTAKLPFPAVVALAFKSWIAFRDGTSIRCLKWSASEGSYPSI